MTQSVVVRLLTVDDAAVAQGIICRFKGTQAPLDHVRALLANPTNCLFVARVGEEIAGFLYAHRLNRLGTPADHLFIYEIEVAPEHRRQGVGRALVERVRQIDPAAECFVLTERSNVPALHFYRATGGSIEQEAAVLFVYGVGKRQAGDSP